MNKLRLLVLYLPVIVACGSGNGLMTKGAYCSSLATPTCNREIACGNIPSSEDSYCLTSFQAGCCGNDNSCGQQAQTAADNMELQTIIADCSAALATASCADLAAGNPPVACGGTSTYYAPPGVVAPQQAGAAARTLLK